MPDRKPLKSHQAQPRTALAGRRSGGIARDGALNHHARGRAGIDRQHRIPRSAGAHWSRCFGPES
eukprot:4446962-Pyramimonas_sp.AAC.1